MEMGRSSILKKLEKYLMSNEKRGGKQSGKSSKMLVKSGSWPKKTKMTPNGCFSVYVGPTRQRFVIKTESANHPLFRMLLEDAELEYGFKNEGPLLLPCDCFGRDGRWRSSGLLWAHLCMRQPLLDQMEAEKAHDKRKNPVLKKLGRLLTRKNQYVFSKSRSWHVENKRHKKTKNNTPRGCFTVYVGPDKQRFVVRTESASHPLFKMLLEDAELEYGFESGGPLLIPCEVDLFCRILAEMDGGDGPGEYECGLGLGCGSPFSPARRLGKSEMGRVIFFSNIEI
ncbi:SAUR-like auxin-responsive protein family [Striga asiatica]|uniref:SAUR-like auxin-responsive protein family n=1 Tax=Striga asiatica TaxID=4170 RepID=A0A5A7QT65_STRAF|nr:SAUR-like auxin-responsive protein family [Striga asiatica]